MDSLRMASMELRAAPVACCRCGNAERCWDQMAGKAYCPNCQEALILGEMEPLIERIEKQRCVVCHQLGTLRYLTFTLQQAAVLEMDLCPEHLRSLVARRMPPHAFHQLLRELHGLGLDADDVFLLHDAFYDAQGRALQPAIEPA